MPWTIEKRDDQYCVIKTGTGDNEGCHATRDEAVDQLQALYASEDNDEGAQDFLEFNLRNLNSALKNVNEAIDRLEDDPPKVSGALGDLRSAKKSLNKAIDSYPVDYPRRRIIIQPPPSSPPPPPPSAGEVVTLAHEEVSVLLNRAVEALDGPHAPAEVRTWLIEATRVLNETYDHDFEEPVEEIYPIQPPMAVPAEAPSTEHIRWEGAITYENEYTGDQRIFQDGAVVWNEELLPFPFKWQRVSADGHDQSITIGRVDRIFRGSDYGTIRGEGVILSGPGAPPEAAEYLNLLANGAAGGVSIDGDAAEFEVLYDETPDGALENIRTVFSRINIRALTAVDIPAFAGARIQLTEDSLVGAVIGATDLPVADRDRRWDGLAAQRGIFSWAETEDGFDTTKLGRAFLYRDSDADPQLKGSYKLPFTELIDGTLTIVPKAVFAAAGAIEGARGGVNIPDADRSGIRRKLGTLYGKINSSLGEGEEPVKPPWETGEASITDEEEFKTRRRRKQRRYTYSEVEAVLASAIPCDPPAEWFADPKFSELTPITIDDDGRISGHLAGLSCHIGYGNCTTPPRNCDYDNYFHLGALKARDGEEIAVGHMTFGGGHAPTNMSAKEAAARYDSTSKVSADIRCGEDEFGTWVVGALRPGLSDTELREVRSAPLSGDWRPIAGKLQLIAAHGVNVPGFPIPRVKALVAAGGETQTLIIASPEECECEKSFDQILLEMELEDGE